MSNCGEGKFGSPFGTVKMSYPGPFKRYDNIVRYNQNDGNYVEAQAPAIRALKKAEELTTPRRLRRKGKVRCIRVTGHGGRDYAYQKELYEREPGRFANPDCSQHVEFLAFDFNIPWYRPVLWVKVKRALKKVGFNFTVSGEPWHGCFRLDG